MADTRCSQLGSTLIQLPDFRRAPGQTHAGVHGAPAPGAVEDGPSGVGPGLGSRPLHGAKPPLLLNLSLK